MPWQCKICGRSFRNTHQSHSCNTRAVEEAFAGPGLKWFPLYRELLEKATVALPPFYEHCPSVGVMWRDRSTFAEFRFTRESLYIFLFSVRLNKERNPVQYLKTSANRVVHKYSITDNSRFDTIIEWIRESYVLTQQQ